MPVQVTRPVSDARPLTAEEWSRAERVAARLRGGLKGLLQQLPEHARGASGMSRHLGVLRATCQRVVSAVADADASPAVLVRLPGVLGLRQFLDGLRQAGCDAADIEAVSASIDQFAQLIEEFAGSQSRLAERLGAMDRSASEADEVSAESARAELFRAAASVTGRRCEVALSVYAFRRTPGDRGVLEHAMAKGLIGHVSAPGGMPIVLSSGATLPTDASEEGRVMLLDSSGARGRTPEAILERFTTSPLPTITARGANDAFLLVIDPRAASEGEPIDVVTAIRRSNPMTDPATGKPVLDAVWSLVNCPARALVLDVYLHQDIERRFRPAIDAQLWNPGLTLPDEDRWVTRVPGRPRLLLLGRGTDSSATEAYPRHAELTGELFRRVGWDAGEFVGFRCEVSYPVWRAGYVMTFEHIPEG